MARFDGVQIRSNGSEGLVYTGDVNYITNIKEELTIYYEKMPATFSDYFWDSSFNFGQRIYQNKNSTFSANTIKKIKSGTGQVVLNASS